MTRKRDALVVEVHDLHVDISLRGIILFTSENYSNVSNARRAARRFIDAVNTREMKLVEWRGRHGSMWRVTRKVRRLMTGGQSTPLLSMPVGVRLPANAQFFDSHLESTYQ